MIAVSPATQHGNLRAALLGRARIVEVGEGCALFGLGGRGVLRNACAEQYLRAVAIVHQQLDSAERSVVLSGVIEGGIPCGSAQSHAVGVFVGAVDNAVAGPALAP